MKIKKKFKTNLRGITTIALHRDSQTLVVGTNEATAVVINTMAVSGEHFVIKGFKQPIKSVQIDQPRQIAYISAFNGTLARVDLKARITTNFEENTNTKLTILALDLALLICITYDGEIQFRSSETLARKGKPLSIKCEPVMALWNESKKTLIVGGEKGALFLIKNLDSSPIIIDLSLESSKRYVTGLLPIKKNADLFLVLFEAGHLEVISFDGEKREIIPIIFPARTYGLVQLDEHTILTETEQHGSFTIDLTGQLSQFSTLGYGQGICPSRNGELAITLDSNDGILTALDAKNGETYEFMDFSEQYPMSIMVSSDDNLCFIGFQDGSVLMMEIPEHQDKSSTLPALKVKKLLASNDSNFAFCIMNDDSICQLDEDFNEIKFNNNYHIVELTKNCPCFTGLPITVSPTSLDDEKNYQVNAAIMVTLSNNESRKIEYYEGYAISSDCQFIARGIRLNGYAILIESLFDNSFKKEIRANPSKILISPDNRYIVSLGYNGEGRNTAWSVDIFEIETGILFVRYLQFELMECDLEGFLNDVTVLVRHAGGALLVLRLDCNAAISVGVIPSECSEFVFIPRKQHYFMQLLDGSFSVLPLVVNTDNHLQAPFATLVGEVTPTAIAFDINILYAKTFDIQTAYEHAGTKGAQQAYLDHWSFELKGKELENDGALVFLSNPCFSPLALLTNAKLLHKLPVSEPIDEPDADQRQIVAHELYHVFQSLSLPAVYEHLCATHAVEKIRLEAGVILAETNNPKLDQWQTLVSWFQDSLKANFDDQAVNVLIRSEIEALLAYSGSHDNKSFHSLVEGSAVIFQHLAIGRAIVWERLQTEFSKPIYTEAIKYYMNAGGTNAIAFLLLAETALYYGQIRYRGTHSDVPNQTPWHVFEFLCKRIDYFEFEVNKIFAHPQADWDDVITSFSGLATALHNSVAGEYSILRDRELSAADEHAVGVAMRLLQKRLPTTIKSLQSILLLSDKQNREEFVKFTLNDLATGMIDTKITGLGRVAQSELRPLLSALRVHDQYFSREDRRKRKYYCCKEHGNQFYNYLSSCTSPDSTYQVLTKFFNKTLEELHEH